MTLSTNQFSQQPVQGQMDLAPAWAVVGCQVDTSQATPLVPGQAVKLVTNSSTGVPSVVAVTAITDDIFGFVKLGQKINSFPALSAVEIAVKGAVMFMTSSAAFARGARLMWVTGNEVAARTPNTKCTVLGWAYDQATAAGQLVRVWINTPSDTYGSSVCDLSDGPASLVANGTVTVNSGGTQLLT